MGLETIAFVFGSVLLLVGIIGGGFELRELKIPKVGGGARLLATVAGVVFVAIGISVQHKAEAEGRSGIESRKEQSVRSVDFTIHDHCGENQVSEQVSVMIDGRMVGNLTVNPEYSNATLTVTVPRPGRYSYTIESAAVFNIDGYPRELQGAGQGMIDVDAGKQFDLAGSFTGNSWIVSLVERR